MESHLKNHTTIDIIKKFSMMTANCFEKPKYFVLYSYAVPTIFTCAQLPALAYILFYLYHEKKQHIFRYLNLIKIDSTMYIILNRIIDFIISLIPFIPVFIIFKIAQIIVYTNFTTIIIFSILFLMASNTLFMLFASFFKDHSISIIVGLLVFMIGSVISIRFKMDIFIPYGVIHRFLVIHFFRLANFSLCSFLSTF